jgi:hypothetical protein
MWLLLALVLVNFEVAIGKELRDFAADTRVTVSTRITALTMAQVPLEERISLAVNWQMECPSKHSPLPPPPRGEINRCDRRRIRRLRHAAETFAGLVAKRSTALNILSEFAISL